VDNCDKVKKKKNILKLDLIESNDRA